MLTFARPAILLAQLDVQVKDGLLVIKTETFARTVTIGGDANGDQFGWFLEDNCLDLMPGEDKAVRILGGHAKGRITAKLSYSPHASSVEWQR